jgi:RimJ/RimL family protein N-acetyltransferase
LSVLLDPDYPVRTDRLNLRPLSEADVSALVSYHSNPEVNRFLPFDPLDADAITARVSHGSWSRSTLDEEGDILVLGAEPISSGLLIGDVMLRWVSAKDRCGEVGYAFHPDHGGCGFATEAVKAVLELAFGSMDLHRVIARIDPRNAPSLNLARRLGMRQEAHLVENHWQADEWMDEIDFGLLQSEWRHHAESA